MLDLLSTLLKGTNPKTVDGARAHLAIALLNRKTGVSPTESGSSTLALADLVARRRSEQALLNHLRSRKSALEDRVRQALTSGRNAFVMHSADVIADLENEET